MNYSKVKNYLEVATNVAVLLVAIVILTAVALEFFNRSQKPNMLPGLQRGQKLDRLPFTFDPRSTQTLIIAMSTRCHYCNESVPFYNDLAERQKQANHANTMVAVFADPESEVRTYSQKQGLKITTVATTDLGSFNVGATPTMILLDSSGKVLDFWVGKLSQNEQQQVIEAVTLPRA